VAELSVRVNELERENSRLMDKAEALKKSLRWFIDQHTAQAPERGLTLCHCDGCHWGRAALARAEEG
jgi:Tfp pilus assembly protein PilX